MALVCSFGREFHRLPNITGINPTLLPYGMSITERPLYTPKIHVAFHRTPSTFAQNDFFGYRPSNVRAHEYDICLITFAQEATMAYTKECCWMVAHQFYKSFKRKDTLINEFQHRHQRKLNHRHATGSLGTTSFFLRKQMGGMIRTNNTDSSIIQRLTQRLTITFRLDGWIALDACSKQGIVPVTKVQMRNRSLCSDVRMRVPNKE